MQKWIAMILTLSLLVCFAGGAFASAEDTIPDFLVGEDIDFESLDDPAFQQYLEDSIYAQLEAEFAGSESVYRIDDVSVTYISREYLEETAYNSKANIFFGYSLAQIDEIFQGEKYVFTLSNEGETVVQEFMEIPDDTYDRVIKNVLIGAGVILVCVTVSVVTAGLAAPAAAAAGGSSVSAIVATGAAATGTKVHLIFTAAANTATTLATKGAFFAGATTLVTRGYETGWDKDAMIESALVDSSEAFKWGAITGAVAGGSTEALRIRRLSRGTITPTEAEQAALEYYGGEKQVSYLNGEEVPYGTPGSVRPDLVYENGPVTEAVEVKYYDLMHKSNLYELKTVLTAEITERVENLPDGMRQRIVLNIEGRGYTRELVDGVADWIQDFLNPIYEDIPIDIMGATIN